MKIAKTLGMALVAAGLALPAFADSFTLRVGTGHPNGPTVYVNDLANFFVPEVKRRVESETSHKIDFVEGYGGSIAGVAEILESVQNGILDIGAYCFCFEPAKLFMHNFPYYAPFGPTDSVMEMKATRAVYDQVPWLTQQFETEYNQKLLGLHGWDNYHLGTTMPWEKVSDLKGVKIGGAGPNLPWLEFAGAIPVQSTLPDGYMSMQTGVYNGWLMFPSAYLGYKFYEPAPYYTLIGFGSMGVNGLTINLDTYNRLPPEVQQIILEVGKQYEEKAGESLNATQAKALDGLAAAGAQIKTLGEDVRAEWASSLVSFPNQQAKDADGRGMPGSDIMNAYIKAVSDLGYKWPVDYKIE